MMKGEPGFPPSRLRVKALRRVDAGMTRKYGMRRKCGMTRKIEAGGHRKNRWQAFLFFTYFFSISSTFHFLE
jgi:hypothetical protein